MSENDNIGFIEQLKIDGEKAAYRIAETQAIDAVSAGILMMLKDKGVEGSHQETAAAFFSSPIGKSVLATFLGNVLNRVPPFNENEHVIKLCDEMRVDGIAKAGNFAIEELSGYFLPGLTQTIDKLDSALEKKALTTGKTAVRVPGKAPVVRVPSQQEEEHHEQAEEAKNGKVAALRS